LFKNIEQSHPESSHELPDWTPNRSINPCPNNAISKQNAHFLCFLDCSKHRTVPPRILAGASRLYPESRQQPLGKQCKIHIQCIGFFVFLHCSKQRAIPPESSQELPDCGPNRSSSPCPNNVEKSTKYIVVVLFLHSVIHTTAPFRIVKLARAPAPLVLVVDIMDFFF
jgi:hypothetical protein